MYEANGKWEPALWVVLTEGNTRLCQKTLIGKGPGPAKGSGSPSYIGYQMKFGAIFYLSWHYISFIKMHFLVIDFKCSCVFTPKMNVINWGPEPDKTSGSPRLLDGI